MASCTQIESLIQAYIDGELKDSERVIFEQHIAECPACALVLRRHQRMSATMFEAFAEDRLSMPLRQGVLEHLPEFEQTPAEDLEVVNWRAKHPGSRFARLARRLPAAVAFMLLIVAFVIRAYWPEPDPSSERIGVIAFASGDCNTIEKDSLERRHTDLGAPIKRGMRLETGSDSRMELSLLGATQLRLDESTRICVQDERRVTVEVGEAWLDVGSDRRLFKVHTPSSDITVFGTRFLVAVGPKGTVVTVTRGEVQVASNSGDGTFVLVTEGQRTHVAMGESPSLPERVDAAAMTLWVSQAEPDSLSAGTAVEIEGKEVWRVSTRRDGRRLTVSAIRLYWERDHVLEPDTHCCGYDVYVYDEQMTPRFKARVEGAEFGRERTGYVEIPVPGGGITDANAVIVRTVPDSTAGEIETSLSVKACGF